MGKQDTASRVSGSSKLKRRRAPEQPLAAPGHSGTNQLSYATPQSRKQHQKSHIPPEKNVSVTSSAQSGHQPDHFMYGSEPPATDGSDTEEDETGSEASLANADPEPSLTAVVVAMAAQFRTMAAEFRTMTTAFQSMNEILRELVDVVRTNSEDHRNMRAAALLHKDAVQMFVEWHKLNNMPNISPVPGFAGTGPATFAHRNQQQGPQDQGGAGQGFAPNVLYNGS